MALFTGSQLRRRLGPYDRAKVVFERLIQPTQAEIPPMLIDDFMPKYDAVERHEIAIEAPATEVYGALRELDFRDLMLVKILFLIRGLPSLLSGRKNRQAATGPLTLDSLIRIGFVYLAELPGTELVLGVTGRFWHPVDNIASYPKESFGEPVPPGLARAVWIFAVTEDDGLTTLITETRILCADRSSRRKFRLYWMLVRPFSGLIRILLLRRVRSSCGSTQRDDSRSG